MENVIQINTKDFNQIFIKKEVMTENLDTLNKKRDDLAQKVSR